MSPSQRHTLRDVGLGKAGSRPASTRRHRRPTQQPRQPTTNRQEHTTTRSHHPPDRQPIPPFPRPRHHPLPVGAVKGGPAGRPCGIAAATLDSPNRSQNWPLSRERRKNEAHPNPTPRCRLHARAGTGKHARTLRVPTMPSALVTATLITTKESWPSRRADRHQQLSDDSWPCYCDWRTSAWCRRTREAAQRRPDNCPVAANKIARWRPWDLPDTFLSVPAWSPGGVCSPGGMGGAS
jgi:hypothetical protein